MKTNLLTIRRAHPGAWAMGERIARRLHVSIPTTRLVREVNRSFLKRYRLDPAVKATRKAAYLGAMSCLRTERRLMAAFRL